MNLAIMPEDMATKMCRGDVRDFCIECCNWRWLYKRFVADVPIPHQT